MFICHCSEWFLKHAVLFGCMWELFLIIALKMLQSPVLSSRQQGDELLPYVSDSLGDDKSIQGSF